MVVFGLQRARFPCGKFKDRGAAEATVGDQDGAGLGSGFLRSCQSDVCLLHREAGEAMGTFVC